MPIELTQGELIALAFAGVNLLVLTVAWLYTKAVKSRITRQMR